MKRITCLLGALALLAGVLTVTATAGDEHPENVTLCHASGLAGTTKYETITVGYPAAYGPAGHFDENGTPNAGHEQDYLGECNPPPPPTDVCPNLEGDQTEIPPGYHAAEDENGRPICVQDENPPPPPVDVCPNLEGNQGTVPDGFTLIDGECVIPPPPPCTINCGPPHVVAGAAAVFCDSGSKLYRTRGTIDGNEADSVTPATIAGNVKGVTNVTVTRGDTTYFTTVTTLGDCNPDIPTVVATVAAVATPVTTPPPAAKPVAKPKPVRKPAAKPKPKPAPKAKPKPKAPKKKAPQAPPHTLGIN